MNAIITFMLMMWALLLAGGGVMVAVLGPISITGFGDWDHIITSGTKAVIAIILVVAWVFILSKVKNWIFHRQIKFH